MGGNLTNREGSEGRASPAVMTEQHLDFFRATSSFAPDDTYGGGEMLFARKFADGPVDLVAKLDKQIMRYAL